MGPHDVTFLFKKYLQNVKHQSSNVKMARVFLLVSGVMEPKTVPREMMKMWKFAVRTNMFTC